MKSVSVCEESCVSEGGLGLNLLLSRYHDDGRSREWIAERRRETHRPRPRVPRRGSVECMAGIYIRNAMSK